MKDYIEQALSTEAPTTIELDNRLTAQVRAVHAFFGLLTEIGELADAFKRHIFYGKDLDLTNVDEEIGDVLWYLAILMNHCGVDFESCMARNIAKLRARYPNKFTEYDAVHRDLANERKVLETCNPLEPVAGEFVPITNLAEEMLKLNVPSKYMEETASPKGIVRCPFCFKETYIVPKVMNQRCGSCDQLMVVSFLPDGSVVGASKS